jgi:hypothetical protein
MKSPFPGMDPYIERHWPDVNTTLVVHAAGALNTTLPAELVARIQERIAVESEDDGPDCLAPDVTVLVAAHAPESEGSSSGGALGVPYRLEALIEPITERFIQIIEVTGERLITVIEFLNPTNKRRKGLRAFRGKGEKLLAGRVISSRSIWSAPVIGETAPAAFAAAGGPICVSRNCQRCSRSAGGLLLSDLASRTAPRNPDSSAARRSANRSPASTANRTSVFQRALCPYTRLLEAA